MVTRLERLSESISLDEQKALCDFLSISTRRQSKVMDMQQILQVSLTLALRERKRHA